MSKDDFILKAEGVYKSYQMGATELQVLKGVNLAVKKGEFLAVVGASGSGKSTLLHILGALDSPDKGTVRFDGRDLSRFNAGERGNGRQIAMSATIAVGRRACHWQAMAI